MKSQTMRRAAVLLSLAIPCAGLFQIQRTAAANSDGLDSALVERLRQLGFTGNVEATLENRLGRAVDRTRARRLLREAFRLHQPRLAQAVDVVLVARASIVGKRLGDVARDYVSALKKARLYREAGPGTEPTGM